MTELEEDGMYVCGTARKDRRGFPDQLKKVNLKNRYTNKIMKILNTIITYYLIFTQRRIHNGSEGQGVSISLA